MIYQAINVGACLVTLTMQAKTEVKRSFCQMSENRHQRDVTQLVPGLPLSLAVL